MILYEKNMFWIVLVVSVTIKMFESLPVLFIIKPIGFHVKFKKLITNFK